MNRILLADDDTIVRLYLTEIVEWNQYDLEVVGAARDGEEALEMVRTLDPDIVLTDISMPKMDGVKLIHHLREEGYDGVINVLSCHDDFELVKNAMQEGADDYLLKNHLNDRSINDIISKINDQLKRRKRQSVQRDNLQTLATKGMKVLRRELITSILGGMLTEEKMEEGFRNAGLHGKYRRLITVSIRPLNADREQLDSLLTLCEQRLTQEKAEILYLHDDILVMMIDLTDEPSARRASEMSNRLQTLIQRLTEQYLNLQVAMASSAVCEGKNAIADSIRQANVVQQNSFYGPGRWQYGVDGVMSSELPEQAVRFAAELSELLSDAEEATIRRLYTEALNAIKKRRVSPGDVLSWLHDCDEAAGVHRTEAQYTTMKQWESYKKCVDTYLEAQYERQNSKVPETAGPAIRRAVQYIYAHFDEPISLAVVSQHVHLTSTYFSTLFKQEMGVGFSEFLTTLRLEWVCDRIKSTSLTIKQISEDAGFPDYPYFCKTFKKAYGISPAAYRKANG